MTYGCVLLILPPELPPERQKEQREKYWNKLFPLLGKDQLETQITQRPFLGITPQSERDMAEGIEFWVAKGKS